MVYMFGEYACIRKTPYFKRKLLQQHGATVMMTTHEGADRRKYEECVCNFSCVD